MKIDNELMFRFFRNEHTKAEADALGEWLEGNEAHQEEFRKAYELFQACEILPAGEEKPAAKVTRPVWKSRTILWAVSVAASLLVGVLLTYSIGRRAIPSPEETMTAVATGGGERASITLPDGSTVALNSGSRLTYPAIFTDGERRVRVEGEAMFKVEKDDEHPFVVETFACDVKVTGTRFSVEVDEERNVFSTSLLEGGVQILDKNRSVLATLKPDEMAWLENGAIRKGALREDTVEWVDGIISVGGKSFEDVIRAYEKAFGVKIIVDRSEMPENHMGRLRVRVSDGIEVALRVLQSGSDFTYTRDNTSNIYHIK